MSAAPRIAVLGGGIAALAAAHALGRSGAHVTLIEPPVALSPLDDSQASVRCAVPGGAPLLLATALELGLAARVRLWPIELAAQPAGADSPLHLARALSALRAPLERLRERRLRQLLAHCAPWLDPARPERSARLDDRSAAEFARLYLGRGPLARRLLGALELLHGLDPGELSRLVPMFALDAWGELAPAWVSGLGELCAALRAGVKELRCAVLRSASADGRALELDSGESIAADALLATGAALASSAPLAGLLDARDRAALCAAGALESIALRVHAPASAQDASPRAGSALPADAARVLALLAPAAGRAGSGAGLLAGALGALPGPERFPAEFSAAAGPRTGEERGSGRAGAGARPAADTASGTAARRAPPRGRDGRAPEDAHGAEPAPDARRHHGGAAAECDWLLRARPRAAAAFGNRSDAWWVERLLAEAGQLWPGLLRGAQPGPLERTSAPLLRVGSFRSAARLRERAAARALPVLLADVPSAGPDPESQLRAGLRAAEDCLTALAVRRPRTPARSA